MKLATNHIRIFRLNSVPTNFASIVFSLEPIFRNPVVIGSILGSIALVSLVLNYDTVLSLGSDIFEKVQSPSTSIGLYGRVPYDDYLFSTWRLTDPNLLKRSLPEVITDEMPDVLTVYQKRIKLYEVGRIMAGFAFLGALFLLVGTLYSRSGRYFQSSQRMNHIAGSAVGISAVQKGTRRKRLFDNGIYAMDEFEDEQEKE